LLREVSRIPMQINWEELIEYQVRCLEAGANGVGIPDLIIAQNAKANNCRIYSLDKHFRLLSQIMKLKLY
jgi:predicted nucleic acid-binding protein